MYVFNVGGDEIKLVALSALESWVSKSTGAVQADFVSFIATGLKEKETFRKGCPKCLQVICKNSESLTRVGKFIVFLRCFPCLLK